jgi:hypothetical protein
MRDYHRRDPSKVASRDRRDIKISCRLKFLGIVNAASVVQNSTAACRKRLFPMRACSPRRLVVAIAGTYIATGCGIAEARW